MELNKIYCEDNRETMSRMPDNFVDSIVTDPPYELGFMGKKWDSSGIAYDVKMWKECLRVLKPGGYLLAFGGTRTSHRMVCAIEDAGFEIRDSILWLYGSGFPKSLNIGKEIDRLQGNEREVVGEKITGADSKNSDGVLRLSKKTHTNNNGETVFNLTKGNSEYEGYGTALKPAHEPICVARKPLSDGGIDNVKNITCLFIENGLKNILWRIKRVKPVKKQKTNPYSCTTGQPKTVEVSVKTVSATEMQYIGKGIEMLIMNRQENTGQIIEKSLMPEVGCNTEQIKKESSLTGRRISKKEKTGLLKNMEENANAVEKQEENFSQLIIPMEEGTHTESLLKTVTSTSSCEKADTQKKDSGCFVGTAIAQWVCMDIVRTIKIKYQNKEYEFDILSDDSIIWNEELDPYIEPRAITVAANVLKYGTGGINIDGCRIESNGEKLRGGDNSANYSGSASDGWNRKWRKSEEGLARRKASSDINQEKSESLGRFPANIILNEFTAQELDKQAPNTGAFAPVKKGKYHRSSGIYGEYYLKGDDGDTFYDDKGGASRFFYIAKADSGERNEGLYQFESKFLATMGDGIGNREHNRNEKNAWVKNNHPTVKPLKLMQYLQRLVTPKGGLTYDPFGGSGTSAISASNEGFKWILSEMVPEHCDIATKRVYHNNGLFNK